MFKTNRKSLEESNLTAGSLGAKINKLRELRNLSQRELGLMCGFKDTTADSRIAQYEKMKRTPSDEVLCDIAETLGVSKYALYHTDISLTKQMYHVLFDLEEIQGLEPVNIDGKIYLRLNGNKENTEIVKTFLDKWYSVREKYLNDARNSDNTDVKKDYDLWKASYPEEYIKYEKYQDVKRLNEIKEDESRKTEENA